MSEKRRLEAELDIQVSPQSHQSMADFLKKVEKAEQSAKNIREMMGPTFGGGGGSPYANGRAGSESGPSVPWPGGSTAGWSPMGGFTHGNGSGVGGMNGVRDYGEKLQEIERTSRRIRDNIADTTSRMGNTAFWGGNRPKFNEGATAYAPGGSLPGPTGIPFPGAVPSQFYQTHLAPTRIPFPGQTASAGGNWAARDSSQDLPDHFQTMNKFGPRHPTLGERYHAAGNALGQLVTQPGVGILSLAQRLSAPLGGIAYTAGAANAFHNVGMVEAMGGNANDMARAGARSTWIGRQVMGTADAITGRSQAIAVQEFRNQFTAVDAMTTERIRAFKDEMQRERIPLESAKEVREGDTRYASLGKYDLRTFRGQTEYREAQMMLPVERERIERERQLKIEERSLREMEKQKERVEKQKIASDVELKNTPMQGNLKKSGVEFIQDFGKFTQEMTRNKGLANELQQINQAIEAQKGRFVNATGNLNQVQVMSLRTQAEIAGGRRGLAESQANRIGSMSPFELMQNRAAFEAVQNAGTLDGIPDSVIQRAAAFDPQTIQKMQENRGIQRIDELGLARDKVGAFRDRLPDIEESERQLKNAAEKTSEEFAAAAAKMLADVLRSPEFIKNMEKVFRAEGDNIKKEIQAKQGVAQAQQ